MFSLPSRTQMETLRQYEASETRGRNNASVRSLGVPKPSMMQYIEAPNEEAARWPSLFLAGGITGVKDNWQAKAAQELKDLDITVFNPRRKEEFKPEDEEAQIKWEHNKLYRADAISFWFPPDTLCPITLYELGAWSQWIDPWKLVRTKKRLFVSVHPKYARLNDVLIQTRLARPEVHVVVEEAFSVQPIRDWLVPSA